MSAIFDYGWKKWNPPQPNPFYPPPVQPTITPEEIAEFRRLLEAARRFDEVTGQPDCETEEKKARVKDLLEDLAAEFDLNIDITFLD